MSCHLGYYNIDKGSYFITAIQLFIAMTLLRERNFIDVFSAAKPGSFTESFILIRLPLMCWKKKTIDHKIDFLFCYNLIYSQALIALTLFLFYC